MRTPRNARPLLPAATGMRAPARLALRFLLAAMPLLPSLAHADTTLPGGGDNKDGAAHVTLMPQPIGDVHVTPLPQPIGDVRVTPPLPGTMPAPHLPPARHSAKKGSGK